MREVDEGFVVRREQLRRLAGFCFMAGVGAVGRIALRKRRRAAEGRSRRQRQCRDQHAVEAATAILHGAAVPLQRQVHLEADVGRRRIDRLDVAEHAAEGWRRGRDTRGRRRPALGDGERFGIDDGCGVDLHRAGAGQGRAFGSVESAVGGYSGRCRRGTELRLRPRKSACARGVVPWRPPRGRPSRGRRCCLEVSTGTERRHCARSDAVLRTARRSPRGTASSSRRGSRDRGRRRRNRGRRSNRVRRARRRSGLDRKRAARAR